MNDTERQFFAAWWVAFRDAPTNVSLLLSTGTPDLIAAASIIAPAAPHLGPVSGTTLGKWLTRRSANCIDIDGSTILDLIQVESTMPGRFWRLRLKEEMADAA